MATHYHLGVCGTQERVLALIVASGAGDGDVLRLLNTGWTSIAQVQAATTDTGNGYSILSLDADTAIWMIGVTPAQLVQGDVIFA